jgi:hypothetical protein
LEQKLDEVVRKLNESKNLPLITFVHKIYGKIEVIYRNPVYLFKIKIR